MVARETPPAANKPLNREELIFAYGNKMLEDPAEAFVDICDCSLAVALALIDGVRSFIEICFEKVP